MSHSFTLFDWRVQAGRPVMTLVAPAISGVPQNRPATKSTRGGRAIWQAVARRTDGEDPGAGARQTPLPNSTYSVHRGSERSMPERESSVSGIGPVWSPESRTSSATVAARTVAKPVRAGNADSRCGFRARCPARRPMGAEWQHSMALGTTACGGLFGMWSRSKVTQWRYLRIAKYKRVRGIAPSRSRLCRVSRRDEAHSCVYVCSRAYPIFTALKPPLDRSYNQIAPKTINRIAGSTATARKEACEAIPNT